MLLITLKSFLAYEIIYKDILRTYNIFTSHVIKEILQIKDNKEIKRWIVNSKAVLKH